MGCLASRKMMVGLRVITRGVQKNKKNEHKKNWEDAGRPGEDNDNNDDENVDDDSENDNNANDDNRYCDQDDSGSCWDRKDYDEETGLYPCIDGSQVTDWRKWTDDNDNYNTPKVVHKTTVIQSPSASVTINTNPAEAYSCRLEGSADGIHQKFDAANYQECTIYVNGQDAYTDGFVTGCPQVGNSEQLCQAFVHSSITKYKISTDKDSHSTGTDYRYDYNQITRKWSINRAGPGNRDMISIVDILSALSDDKAFIIFNAIALGGET